MTKFYVYTLISDDPDDRNCIYVEEQNLRGFARQEFSPATHVYSGVSVEAKDVQKANEVYNTFGAEADGEIILEDEPHSTALKRKAFEARKHIDPHSLEGFKENLLAAKNALEELQMQSLVMSVLQNLEQINKHTIRLAKLIRSHNETSPEITVETIYERLRANFIRKFKKDFHFKKRDDDDSPPQGPSIYPGGFGNF